MPEKTVRNFLQQLAAALKACHERNISHFDLKPQNILISRKNVFYSDNFVILKLADFGFAKHLDNDTVRDLRGTPLYMAPEVLFRSEYDGRADLWSVGIILYEILVGKTPFHSKDIKELIMKLEKNQIRMPCSVKLSPECHHLLVSLLQKNPNQRISFQDFFSHPFLDLNHMPCLESYNKGCGILNGAVEFDKKGDFSNALDSYLNGLDYLLPIYNFGLPLNDETTKLALTRDGLKSKIESYINRAQVVKNKSRTLTSQEETCFFDSYDECIHGDLLFENERFKQALQVYKKNLEVIIPILRKMPASESKDVFGKQVSLWMTRAEEAKRKAKREEEHWVPFTPRQRVSYQRPRRNKTSVDKSIDCRVQ